MRGNSRIEKLLRWSQACRYELSGFHARRSVRAEALPVAEPGIRVAVGGYIDGTSYVALADGFKNRIYLALWERVVVVDAKVRSDAGNAGETADVG